MKNKIKKEYFIKFMGQIKTIENKTNKLLEIGFDINSELIKTLFTTQDDLINIIINLMEDEYRTIEWFIYEHKWGTTDLYIIQTIPKEIIFKLKTIEELYDYVIKWGKLK